MKPEKIEMILSAACQLFAESDFHNVSMADVAASAGVGKGTLYNYFQSKDDLYFSILQSRLEKLLDVLEKAYRKRDDFIRNLRSLILHLYSFMSKYRYFHQIWNREENSLEQKNNTVIIEIRNKILDLIRRVLIQGQNEKLFKKSVDIDISVQLIYCMINYLSINNHTGDTKEIRIDSLMEILLTGIGIKEIDTSVHYEVYIHESK
ncbi:MAG: TetR/AcrR family transcriptional regulator [Spirochaetia bacterium]|jgi:AcrR family transcriptional regulator|nr:TetR/AcrR family transcriptional regulator [Spirochaetia bacterium]